MSFPSTKTFSKSHFLPLRYEDMFIYTTINN